MRLETIYKLLEDWETPERLTINEDSECFTHWCTAISSMESILHVMEEKHPHEDGVSE